MKRWLCLFFLFAGVAAAAPTDSLYHYNAEVTSIYDGDTIRADINLGLNIVKKNEALRLYGINAPERRGAEKVAGLAARDHLVKLMADRSLIVQTIKDKKGKYGRYIAVLWIKGLGTWCPLDNWCNVNDQMVTDGHAVYKVY